MEFCTVISLTNGVVNEVKLFMAFTTDEVSKQAEDYFKVVCKTVHKEVTDEQLEDALENGYFEATVYNMKYDKKAVVISWPDVDQKAIRPIKVTEVYVKEPDDDDNEANIEIWKDPTSGRMFGVDTSYLEQTRCTGIPSPFNAGEFFDLRDPTVYAEPPVLEVENPSDKA